MFRHGKHNTGVTLDFTVPQRFPRFRVTLHRFYYSKTNKCAKRDTKPQPTGKNEQRSALIDMRPFI